MICCGEMVAPFAEALMAAEVELSCNAGYGEVTPERTNRRKGYRTRPVDTRVGSIDVAIPKLPDGSYFPGWLLEARRRAERALVRWSSSATSGWSPPAEHAGRASRCDRESRRRAPQPVRQC